MNVCSLVTTVLEGSPIFVQYIHFGSKNSFLELYKTTEVGGNGESQMFIVQTTIGKIWSSSSKLWNPLGGKETGSCFASAEEVVVSD